MPAQNFDSTSVTLRIPNDVLVLIEGKVAQLSGKGKRSEVIINLLRKALGQPVSEAFSSLEKVEKLEHDVKDIATQIKDIYDSLEIVRQRLSVSDEKNQSFKDEVFQKLSDLEQKVSSSIFNPDLSSSSPQPDLDILAQDIQPEVKVPEPSIKSTSQKAKGSAINNKHSHDSPSDSKITPLAQYDNLPILSHLENQIESLTEPIQGKDLADRLGINRASLSSKKTEFKDQPDRFVEWLASKDPDKIPWEPCGEMVAGRTKGYLPSKNISSEQRTKLALWLKSNFQLN